MKRSNLCGQHNIVSQVHIAVGFYDDCDELVARCTKLQSVEYQSFCSIWKEMNLGYLYQGRSSGAEIAELTEELIHIAKYYLVRNTSNYEESVTGLFLVYGLMCLQPYTDFAWMRIVPDDVPALKRIEMVARREKRHDVLFILGDILINRCQYHASERERGLEKSFRKYIEGCRGIDKLGVRPKGVFYRQNEELDLIRELGTLTRQYVRAKNSVVGSVSSPSLNYIDEGMPDELDGSLKKIINGFTGDMRDDDDSEDDSEPEAYESVQAIKRKAMTNVVDPMKHLTTVENRKVEKVIKHKTDLKSPKGRIKGVSPKKPIPGLTKQIPGLTGLTQKRNKISPPAPKKFKLSDIYSGPELTKLDITSDTDLNLQEFSQVAGEPPVENEQPAQENTEIVDVETVADLDIELNSLPVIIRTGVPGESIEIEIFDEYKGDTEETASNRPEKPSTSNATGTDPPDERKTIIKKRAALSQKIKRTEKCDLKRNVLKSKFKKMGILPAANFEENVN